MVVDQPDLPNRKSDGAPVIASPVLQSDRVMRVDYSPGINAIKAPALPKNPGRGLFAGAAALAEGFDHVQRFLQGVGHEVEKARTIKQVDESEIAMEQARGEFEAWRINAPDSEWRGEWAKRSEQLRSSLMSQEGLTGTAMEAIESKWKHFAVKTDVDLQTGIATKAFRDAQGTTLEKAKQIAARGEAGATEEFLNLPERAPYVAGGDREQLVNIESESARNNDIAEIPQAVRGWINNPEANDAPAHWRGLSVKQQRDGLNASFISQQGQRQQAFDLLDQAVAQGKIKDMPSFQEWATKNVPKGLLEDGDAKFIERKVRGDSLDNATWNDLYNQVHSFPFNGDAGEVKRKASELRTTIAKSVPREYAQTLIGELNANEQAGKTISDQRRTDAAKIGRSMLDDAFKMELITDEAGAPINYKVNRFLADALTDADKLKAFGITSKEDLETLKKLPDVARISRFKELMAMRKDWSGNRVKASITDVEQFNKLTTFTQTMFTNFLNGDSFEDYANKQKAAGIQRRLVEQMEDGLSAGTIKPDADSVTKWVVDQTRAGLKAKGASTLNGGKAPAGPSTPLLPADGALEMELQRAGK